MRSPRGADQLTRQRRNQLRSMNDECLHREKTWSENDFGELTEDFADGDTFICGYDPESTTEVMINGEVRITNAKIRLPLAVEGVIKATDQVVITKRYHEDLLRMPVYEVIGEPEIGPSAIVLTLQEVID